MLEVIIFQANLIKKADKVKILGTGELNVALKVSAHGFSASAKAAIEKAGGTATLIEKRAKK